MELKNFYRDLDVDTDHCQARLVGLCYLVYSRLLNKI